MTDETRRPILALDTSSATAGVAVYDDEVLAELGWQSGRQHTAQLLPAIDTVLRLANTDKTALVAIVVATGPGSYSGLRVGVSTAMALALALGIDVVDIPTLEAMAWSAASHRLDDSAVAYRPAIEVGRGRYATASYTPMAFGVASSSEITSTSLPELLELAADEGTLLVMRLDRRTWEQARARFGVALRVVPPAAGHRRAGFLAELGARRLERGELVGAGSVEPIYVTN